MNTEFFSKMAKLNEISRIIDDPEQTDRVLELASEFEDILVNLPENHIEMTNELLIALTNATAGGLNDVFNFLKEGESSENKDILQEAKNHLEIKQKG